MDVHPNATTDRLDAHGVDAGDAPAPHRLTTDRLALHRVHPDEVAFDRLHALFADVTDADEVFALCGWDEHDDEAATRTYLDDRAARWERGGYFEYVLESTADGERTVGTACVEVGDDDASEFGLWLRKPDWGRGFSGEAADALVHAAFECLDAPFVVAGCLPANDRSRRAIESFVRRYGGAYYGSPPTVSSSAADGAAENAVVPRHEWAITRDQYETGVGGLSTLVPGVEYDALDL